MFEVYPQAVATLPGSQFWSVPFILREGVHRKAFTFGCCPYSPFPNLGKVFLLFKTTFKLVLQNQVPVLVITMEMIIMMTNGNFDD